ncbi:transporter substrate-binding domain-containing protein [Bermanella marisrubri]|uniref:Probable amino acid ABC transporter, periplasmic amino acid-binding protein n=1 Tax=Bermanella marisrubri TaxID=207949 RepID=Q1N3E1_9GAMM|nr:transporter substrate-binding domain-containing protein [Bermanella marisrubri]EAT12650.1 probable amino acid ABC transporter, periplasmic amino acid-binding protein [Oceanobacter sp. RED65] [Bermanella marisrubri]QIZ85225.1 transporter substrate-binding domain-containing protein [Bermanella marisrubri]
MRIVCLIFAIISIGSSQASQLVVGISEGDYAPFYYDTDEGLTGAAVEIVELIAQQTGHSIAYQRLPWKRVQQYLAQGRIDLVMLYFKSPDRASDVHYVEPAILHESSHLFVMASQRIEFEGDLESLSGFRFGYVDGYWHGNSFEQFEPKVKKTYANSRALITALQRGVIDVAVGNEAVIGHLLKEIGLRLPINFLQPAIDYAPDYIAISRQIDDAENLSADFAKVLEQFTQTQRYRDILKKYGITKPR